MALPPTRIPPEDSVNNLFTGAREEEAGGISRRSRYIIPRGRGNKEMEILPTFLNYAHCDMLDLIFLFVRTE